MRRFTAYRLFLMWDDLQGRLSHTNYGLACLCMKQKIRLACMNDLLD